MELGRDFYTAMIEAFAHEPGAVALWTSMLIDEEKHIVALKQLRASMTREKGETPVSSSTMVLALNIRGIISQARLATIQNLDDAYELAHEFESSEINRVFLFCNSKLISSSDKQLILAHHITEHQKKLSDCGATSGGKRDRRRIAVNRQAVKLGDLQQVT